MEDEDQDTSTLGQLGTIRDQLGELMDPSTTEEAQSYARRFLNKQLNSPLADQQGKLMTEMEKNAEEARQVLRAAREKLMARRYNPADKWYSLAAALGAPTRVGGVGDLAGRAATALNQNREKRETFEDTQQKEALGYDTQISNIDQKLLALKLQTMLGQGKIDASLAQEALKTLGKRVNPQQTAQNKAQQALDREYVKDYKDWIQDGRPVAEKSLNELGQARDRLRGYRVDENGVRVPIQEGDYLTRQLGPTGPVSGGIATIPYVGKAIQDVAMPGSSDIREMVEATVQGSLRPILGAQFTEKEGERLISRVYNPRLKPEVNSARVERLMNQIAEATRNKNAAAKWFEEHGTLSGFQGKVNYSMTDFMPKLGNELAEPSPNPDDDLPARESPASQEAPPPVNNALPKPIGTYNGKPVYRQQDLPAGRVKKKLFGFAEGGSVPDTIYVQMDDGTIREAPANATQADLTDEGPGKYDSALSRTALAGLGAGVGYVGSKLGLGLGNSLHDLLPGRRETSAESRLLQLMERQNLNPSSIVSTVRRNQRSGVPSLALDTSDDLRALAAQSLPQGGAESQDLLDRLRRRQEGSRGRVGDQINKALKPDDYFDKEDELKTALYGNKEQGIESNSGPLYRAAEDQFPAVKSKQLLALMDTPSGQKAVKAARKTMEDKGKPIGKADATGMASKYSLEFLNQVKIELDDMISKEEAKGATGKGKTLRDLRNAFRTELDAATTDPQSGESPYKAARAQNELDRTNLGVLQQGRDEFGRMQPQEVSRAVEKMSFEQKDAFRTGVAQKLSEMLNSPSTDLNAARRLIGSPAMRAKLEALFDKPSEFKVFQTALEKEMELHDSTRDLLRREPGVRARNVEPTEGILSSAARKAPALGVFSPTYWTLKYLRENPEMSDKDAAELIKSLKAGTPDELAQFGKNLGSKFGRKAARKRRSSKVGAAAAALGALAGALGGGDDEAETPDENDPTLVGLDEEGRKWATTPAKKRGGRIGFAEGGKVAALKELFEDLKNRNEMRRMDTDEFKDNLSHIAMRVGETPSRIWQMFQDYVKPTAPTPVNIPAQPEALAPFARSMDFEKQRLKQIADTLDLRRDVAPGRREAMNSTTLAANQAYDRMWKEPTYDNMQRLSELVRALSDQAANKRRGGRIRRQFGGMTNHG